MAAYTTREELINSIYERLDDLNLINATEYNNDFEAAKLDALAVISSSLDGYLLVKGEVL